MKKYFLNRAAVLAATALLACGFTACSDDDDEGGSTPQGPTASYDGKLLTSVGDSHFTFDYDSRGRCTNVYRDGDLFFKIDYDKKTITNDESDVENVSFNSSGYITSLSASLNEDGYNVEAQTTIEYDGNGHIKKSTTIATASYYEDGVRYEESESDMEVYTWNGNLLTHVDYNDEYPNGDKKMTQEAKYDIEYGDTDNKYCQWSQVMEYLGPEEALGFIGMLGKAPAKLVSKYIENIRGYGEQESSEYTYNVTYTLNSDGTISTEKINNYTHNYVYVAQEEDGNSSKSNAKALSYGAWNTNKSKSPLNLYGKMRELKDKLEKSRK